MRRTSQILMLCVLVLSPRMCQGAFQFVAWADNRPYDAANEARFRWMLEQMNAIVGDMPAFHVVPGDYDHTSITTAAIQEVSLIKDYHLVPGNHDTADLIWGHSALDYPDEFNPAARFLFLNEYICPVEEDPGTGAHNCSAGRICSR